MCFLWCACEGLSTTFWKFLSFYMAQDQAQILRFGSALTCPSRLMDCYYLFLFICLFIWEKVSDSLELCSRGWSQILDSPDPPSTEITDVCQHTWIRVKFPEPFFVCLEENEPRCFCFCFVVCSFLYLKFSLTSLACEICQPHTTAINHFIGFLSWSVLSQVDINLIRFV